MAESNELNIKIFLSTLDTLAKLLEPVTDDRKGGKDYAVHAALCIAALLVQSGRRWPEYLTECDAWRILNAMTSIANKVLLTTIKLTPSVRARLKRISQRRTIRPRPLRRKQLKPQLKIIEGRKATTEQFVALAEKQGESEQ